MSEKHLTELPWKVIVTKQGIKDIGLGKALVAYVNIERTKEPAKALEALREISELALKLKKANAGKETVVEHLDEVIKEVKKTISAVEVLVKSANAATATAEKAALPGKVEKEGDETEEEEEDEEFAALKKDLKKQMVSALAQVKARAPGEPEDGKEALPQLKFGAYLAAKATAVIISKKVGPATKKLLLEIAGGVSGGQYSMGECIFEKNAHTFVLDKIPGGLAKKLAQALFAETGAKYKVRARSTDGSTVLDSDTDTDAQFVPAPPPSPSQTPPSPISTASGKEEDKGAGIYQRRIAAVEPAVQRALKESRGDASKIKTLWEFARQKAEGGTFDAALQALDSLEKMLNAPAPPPQPPPAPNSQPKTGETQSIKLSTYLSARGNLRTARESALKELQRLQGAILAKAADEPFLPEIEAKCQRLFDYLTPIDESVINKVDEAGKCPDPELQLELNKKVRELIQKQLNSLRTHPLAPFMEKNPFGKFIIKQPLEVTLSALDKQLS